MRLPKESIEDLRQIYKDEFGETLSYEKAELLAKELLELYYVLLGGEIP